MTFSWLRALAALSVALPAAPTLAAPIVIKTGTYSGGSFYDTASQGFGPGLYRFTIALTTPVQFVDGYAEKLIVTNTYCVDPDQGPDEFYCGGDDVPIQPLWDRATSTLYQAFIRVEPDVELLYPDQFVVRVTQTDLCCDFQYGWETDGPGSYVLSAEAVPEPANWALMVAGFGLLGAGVRGRKVAQTLAPALSS